MFRPPATIITFFKILGWFIVLEVLFLRGIAGVTDNEAGPSLSSLVSESEESDNYDSVINDLKKYFATEVLGPHTRSRRLQDWGRESERVPVTKDIGNLEREIPKKPYSKKTVNSDPDGDGDIIEKWDIYINEWVVHLTGGKEIAKRAIEHLGYNFGGEVKGFKDMYMASHNFELHEHRRETRSVTQHIESHAKVLWAEQQVIKRREKRTAPITSFVMDWIAQLIEYKETNSKINTIDLERIKKLRKDERLYNDKLWSHQWYLFDTRTRTDLPRLDLRVIPVWNSGITGRGINILIIDDGLEWTHEDIIASYNPLISYDLNDDDPDPTPRYDESKMNSHGTQCAGEVVMQPNNGKCGVGIAFGASIGGIRLLDGDVTDRLEGTALAMGLDSVDIVSCSWGPSDDGKTIEGPGKLAQTALEMGVAEGRQGKGTIYVWAAGNGGLVKDNCNCDGYASSIYTIGVNSAAEDGNSPWYSEHCSSTLTSTHSSGAYSDQKIVTTNLENDCTINFSGTSAATPLAAGIIALALEVNPNMTWRDIQHAVVLASKWEPLSHEGGWQKNGVGLSFNPKFGFGLLTAEPLVHVSRSWVSVPPKKICFTHADIGDAVLIESGDTRTISMTPLCEPPNKIKSLEHIQLILKLRHTRRGSLKIMLRSPSGTTTQLLTTRPKDNSEGWFDDWPLMSVHTWGEDPEGSWVVGIFDESDSGGSGVIESLSLALHGI